GGVRGGGGGGNGWSPLASSASPVPRPASSNSAENFLFFFSYFLADFPVHLKKFWANPCAPRVLCFCHNLFFCLFPQFQKFIINSLGLRKIPEKLPDAQKNMKDPMGTKN